MSDDEDPTDGLGERDGPGDPVVTAGPADVDGSHERPTRTQPRWLVVLALGLAVVAGVLVVVLIIGRDDAVPAGGCDGAFAVMAADYAEGNGADTRRCTLATSSSSTATRS